MEPLTIVVTLASGIVLGYWGHTLNSKLAREAREHTAKLARDERLADYESFLLEWEQRIERSSAEDIANAYFREGAAQFRSRAARVRRDFPDRAEFNRRDAALSRLTPEQVRRDPARDARAVLADAIRHVIEYANAT